MYESKLQNEETDALFDAILALESKEDCYRFFEDICTINELKAIAQRWEVARLLNKGMTFNAIVANTGASTATISRVNRCLNYGAQGYSRLLSRLGDGEDEQA